MYILMFCDWFLHFTDDRMSDLANTRFLQLALCTFFQMGESRTGRVKSVWA